MADWYGVLFVFARPAFRGALLFGGVAGLLNLAVVARLVRDSVCTLCFVLISY